MAASASRHLGPHSRRGPPGPRPYALEEDSGDLTGGGHSRPSPCSLRRSGCHEAGAEVREEEEASPGVGQAGCWVVWENHVLGDSLGPRANVLR